MKDSTSVLINTLYNKHGTYNPFHLIEMEGITLRYVHFEDYRKGLYYMVIDRPTIFMNEKLENTIERFFVASHELCHALEHEEISAYYNFNSKSKSTLEHQANLFAFKLCINFYKEEHGHKPTSFVDLNHCYGVPLNISHNLIHNVIY